MKVLNKNEAKSLIELNIERTCVMSLDQNSFGGLRPYYLYATLEYAENEDDFYMNQYGKSGWNITHYQLYLKKIEDGNNKLTDIIDIITNLQSEFTGDMYRIEKDVLDIYMNPKTYHADDIKFIYASNDEIVSWLPYLTGVQAELIRIVYCFIIQDDFSVREKYYREQERYYHIKDAAVAVNEYFGIEEDDKPEECLGDAELKRYNECMNDLEYLAECFADSDSRYDGEYYIWQNIIEKYVESM